MIELEKQISNFTSSQFPAFYQEAGPNFIAFVKAYYEWMEQQGNPIGEIRNFPSNLDIDTTVEQFSSYFKSTYLSGIPSTSKVDRAFSLKHIQDLYKAKGTTEAEKLLFRLIFDSEVEIYNPGNDVIKPSDGIWKIPTYIEVEKNERCVSFRGNRITGSTSGATAIVESVTQRNINGKLINVLYLSDVVGSFQVNEVVSDTDDLTNAPKIVGSLTSIGIIDGGFGISNGDIFDVYGDSGKYGVARVTATVNGTGQVNFQLVDGGSGYSSNTTTVSVSNVVVFHSGNTVGSFLRDENLVQPIYSYSTTNNAIINTGSFVTVLNATSNAVANGIVVSGNTTTLKISTDKLFSGGSTIVLNSNNAINSAVSNVSNVSITAKIMQTNATAVGLVNTSASVVNNAFMIGTSSNAYALTTRISSGNGASFQIGDITSAETVEIFISEFLSANNGFDVPILNLLLDGSNSNTGNSSYGFSSNTSSGYNDYIGSAFSYQNHTLGVIRNIRSIRPGVGYDTPPMIAITNPITKAFSKYDWNIDVANSNFAFFPEQKVVSSSNGVGIIREVSNTSILIKRNSFYGSFEIGDTVTSYTSSNAVSGIATVSSSSISSQYGQFGDNAIVDDEVSSFSGVVSEIQVRDSGHGYANGESLMLVSRKDSNVSITGIATVSKQGKGEGYWENNQGKLDSDKYIHDNYYYQNYSYEIQTELSIDKYAEILKDVFHTAGTEMFGKVVKNVVYNTKMGSTGFTRNAQLNYVFPFNSQYIAIL